jgi:AcrR family transcriptional regulator
MPTTGLTNAEQSDKTRRALLDAARTIFTAQGYAAATTGEVVRQAGVTRGALYYHFHDKAALFEAVFDEVRGEHIEALRAIMATAEGDGWQRLMTWVGLTLERVMDPSVRRIVYLDGPAVLDWSSEQRRAPAIALLREIIAPLMAAGVIERLPLETLARQIWALFFNAAVDITRAEEGGLALHERQVVLRRILSGLRPRNSSNNAQ